MFIIGFLCLCDAMYVYFGGGETRNEFLEMAPISIGIHGSIGLFNEFSYFYAIVMIQEILVVITVSAALFFLGRKFYRHFFSKTNSCEGCAVAKSMEKTA